MREQNFRGAVEGLGVAERLARARNRGVRAAPLDVEQRGARERIGEPVLGVRRAQLLERIVERSAVVGERVVAQRVEGVRERPLAAVPELVAELDQCLAVTARRFGAAAR